MNMTKNKLSTSDMMKKMMGYQMSTVENLLYDMSTGQIGVKNKDGITTISKVSVQVPVKKTRSKTVPTTTDVVETTTEDTFELTVNPFDMFSMSIPAFAIATPLDQVKIMDIVIDQNDKAVGWVTKITGASLRVIKTDGTNSTFTPPKVQMMGMSAGGVKAVKQLFNMEGGFAGVQSSMMPMMMMANMMANMMGGDESSDEGGFADMMQMQLMMQMMNPGQSAGAVNPMASMMPMMMMANMMKGKQGF